MTLTCPVCGNTSPPQPLAQSVWCTRTTRHYDRRPVEMKEPTK